MKKMLINLNLRTRIIIYLTVITGFIFIGAGSVVYLLQKASLEKQSEVRMKQGIADLTNELDRYIAQRKSELDSKMILFEELVNKQGRFRLSSATKTLSAINQVTKEQSTVTFQTLTQGSDSSNFLYSNFTTVDLLKEKTGCYATIFQKINGGYLRISTSVVDAAGKRAVGTYIPDSSPVAKAISEGKEYSGSAVVVGQDFLTHYKPIIIDGSVKGMLFVGLPLIDHPVLKKVFDRKYYTAGYPYMIDTTGKFLIHPKNEGQDASGKVFFKQIKANANKEGSSEYTWPEDNTGKAKIQYFKFYKPMNAYISATLYYDDVFAELILLKYFIIVGVLIGIILISIVIGLIINPMTSIIEKIRAQINILSKGDLKTIDIKYSNKDELGKMITDLNELVTGLSRTENFAKEVGEGHFDLPFEVLSKDDKLGYTLLEMRNSLQNSANEEDVRRKEDERRSWSTIGFAKFGEILRQNNDNLEALSFSIIKNLVEYTGMNQGGMFVYNEDDTNNPHLEMTACYAYSRRKYLTKKIEIGEGLVGTCYLEGKTIFLSEIPQSYMEITSGLGDSNPKCILIVPLKLNDAIYGILELASFKVLEAHEIEFVEKVGESIASTISSVKVNVRTAQLLETSQQQTEMMRAQEEEMRQNMEEMHATQEELQRKDAMTQDMVERMRVQEAELKENLSSMLEKEKYTQDLIETMKQQEEELRQNMEEVHATQEELGRKDIIQQEEIARLNKENEARMQEVAIKEEQMRGVLETCLDAVIIIDNHGFIEFFNHSAETLWGYNRTEVMGKNVKMLMGTEHSSNHDKYLNNYSTTGEKKVIGSGREVQLIRKDGSRKDIFLSLVETKLTGSSRFTAFVRDLTEQKKSEEERNSMMEKALSKEFEFQKKIQELEKAVKDASKQIVVEEKPTTATEDENAPLMVWDDSVFSVRIEEIDTQHKKLVDLINTLYIAFKKGHAKKQLGDILNELISYTASHFGVEEKYFEDFKYENTEAHIAEHKKLVASVLAFKDDFESGKVSVSYDLMKFLKSWLINHIQGSDMKYIDCFLKNMGGVENEVKTEVKTEVEVEVEVEVEAENDVKTEVKVENEAKVEAEKEIVVETKVEDEPKVEVEKKLASKVSKAIKDANTLMVWSDEDFSVQVNEIDGQHKKLVDLINELYAAFKKGEAKKKLGAILDELINYTANHFALEEKYFAEFNYPETDIHIELHKKLVESVLAFKADFEDGKVSVSYDLMNFLKDWLVGHIQGTDRKYTEWFKKNGL